MKKSTLALIVPVTLLSGAVMADSTYVTGNVQAHDSNLHGSGMTSTLEAGHTFDNSFGGLTLLTEFDGIQIGSLKAQEVTHSDGSKSMEKFNSPAYVTLGAEQSFSVNENLWMAVGYHHLMANGKEVQYRPLVKIGYNFDNGISISNRTRAQIDAADKNANDMDVRFDNRIAYTLTDAPVTLSYNNVYLLAGDAHNGDSRDSSMDHELRATWNKSEGVQPYVEYRNQDDNYNNAFVIGASYSW